MRHKRLIVGERVVIKKQARRNVESDEDINRVMLVSGKNEEDAEHVEKPGRRVQEVEISWSI